ncbi:MAG: DUF1456 family protein [Formivibrio sp.]|nr:DUF1456 family protein [Formivibrio sp.]
MRSLRYAMDISDTAIAQIIKLSGGNTEKSDIINMMKKEEEDGYLPCDDILLSYFLDGLIIQKRGPKPADSDGGKPADPRLDNNVILKKLRVAFVLKEEDIEAIMALAAFSVSKPEISAIFRKHGHKNYRPCGDQFLRYFLKGLALKLRSAN